MQHFVLLFEEKEHENIWKALNTHPVTPALQFDMAWLRTRRSFRSAVFYLSFLGLENFNDANISSVTLGVYAMRGELMPAQEYPVNWCVNSFRFVNSLFSCSFFLGLPAAGDIDDCLLWICDTQTDANRICMKYTLCTKYTQTHINKRC